MSFPASASSQARSRPPPGLSPERCRQLLQQQVPRTRHAHRLTGLCSAQAAFLGELRAVMRRVYADPAGLARVADLAGTALRSSPATALSHIFYLGAGQCGVMGLVDASEMPDTYGALNIFSGVFVSPGPTLLRRAVRPSARVSGPLHLTTSPAHHSNCERCLSSRAGASGRLICSVAQI